MPTTPASSRPAKSGGAEHGPAGRVSVGGSRHLGPRTPLLPHPAVTGIGFIGGGAILRDKGSVSGTATAASVWCVGIVGAAVGFGMYHIAVVLSLVTFFTLRYLLALKRDAGSRTPVPAPPDAEDEAGDGR